MSDKLDTVSAPRRRPQQVVALVAQWVRARPFTTGVTVLTLLLALTNRLIFGTRAQLLWDMQTGFEPLLQQGHWWSPVTSAFFTNNIAELIVVLILIPILIGFAERMMGTWRTALAFFYSAIFGPLAGVALQALAVGRGEFWAVHVTEFGSLDPLTPIAGTLLAASGFASVMWRRRIRVLTFLVLAMFLLYSGQPSDLYRMLAAGAGLLLGLVLRPDKQTLRWVRSSQHETRVLLASAVALTAVGPAISLLSASRYGLLAPVAHLIRNLVPDAGRVLDRCQAFDINSHCIRDLNLLRIGNPGSILVTIIPLVLLLLASYGLLRGRRFAVWVAASVNAAFGILSAFYFGFLPVSGQPYVLSSRSDAYWETTVSLALSVAIPIGIATALVILRKFFPVLSPRRSVVRFGVTIAVAAIGLAALYVGGGLLVKDTAFTRGVNFGDLLADVLERFIPVAFLHREAIAFLPTTVVGGILYYGVGPAFWVIVILAAIKPLRDNVYQATSEVIAKVKSMVLTGGGDARAYMATWPGNSYWFDPEANFAIAYRVVGRVAITIGEPFGSLGTKDATLSRFARFCDDNGWIPVFYSIDASYQQTFEAMGWETLVVAEEALIRPADWETVGKKWQDVRSSVNRAERAGIEALWTNYPSLPIATATQLTEISEQWVADKDLPEMGFTLGGIDELRDPAVRLMLAIDSDGRVQGVTSWLPSYRNNKIIGWTLDFMRRSQDSMPGIMEFLIARAAEKMRDNRLEFLSLSAAPLAHTVATSPAEVRGMDRLLGYLSSSLEPVYGFRSLLNFKRKFQPEFHPLLMAYPDQAGLAAIGVALTRAYLPTLTVAQATKVVRGKA